MFKANEEQQGFIDDLTNALGQGPDSPVSKPVINQVQDQDAETEAPSTVTPSTEAPHTEPPEDEEEFATTEAPTTEAPSEEGEEEEIIEMSASQFNKLVERLNSMGKTLTETPGATPTNATVPPAAKPGAKEETIKVSVPELKSLLMTDEELDLVADEPSIINKALQRFYEAVVPALQVASKVPGAVEETVNNILSVRDTVTKFYEENPDIADNDSVREMVQIRFDAQAAVLHEQGQTVNGLALLNSIASAVRKDIGWKEPPRGKPGGKKPTNVKTVKILGEDFDAVVRKRAKPAKGKPTLPGGGGGRKPGKGDAKRAGQAGMIDDLLKDLGAN